MSIKFGFGATFGNFLFNKAAKVGGIVLTAGFMRAAYVELEQYSGNAPEDGRGFLTNGIVYSGKNVVDAAKFIYDFNEETKRAP